MFGPPSCCQDNCCQMFELLPHGMPMTDTHRSGTAGSTTLASPPTNSASEGARRIVVIFNRACQFAPARYLMTNYISRRPNDPQGRCPLYVQLRLHSDNPDGNQLHPPSCSLTYVMDSSSKKRFYSVLKFQRSLLLPCLPGVYTLLCPLPPCPSPPQRVPRGAPYAAIFAAVNVV
ncbi:hypothetical protein EVAR_7768_1 [Eumeta japonica]|uniref:Uncharacterized protein n=1 Tax=Eumeta variegata TaxID=151549 RepID=A0A4C1TM19_EUMVA|nr:hypothetical protein EVAR_7768_1 [Eumeta japonica]